MENLGVDNLYTTGPGGDKYWEMVGKDFTQRVYKLKLVLLDKA